MKKTILLLTLLLFPASVLATEIDISAIQTPVQYRGTDPTLTLRVYSSDTFTTNDGKTVIVGMPGGSWYFSTSCTASGNVLTCQAFKLPSTSDSSKPSAGYTGVLYDSKRNAKETLFTKWRLGKTPTAITYKDWETYNLTRTVPLGDSYYTKAQIDIKLAGLSTASLATDGLAGKAKLSTPAADVANPIVAGKNDYASTTNPGLTRLSVAPVTASLPIAVGDNDPRLALLASGYATIGDALTACASAGKPLAIASSYTISSTTTITCPLRFEPGGKLTASATVTVSANVVADPSQFIFAKSGSGKIVFGLNTQNKNPSVFPNWFGAISDDGLDDYTAINDSLIAIENMSTAANSRGATLQFTAGDFNSSALIRVKRNMIIQGTGGGDPGGYGNTIIRFASNVGGFQLDASTTSPDLTSRSDGGQLRNMRLVGASTGTYDYTKSGVMILSNSFSVYHVSVESFKGAGFWINSTSSNANGWRLDNCSARNNLGSGLFVLGGASDNAGVAVNFQASTNGRFGVEEGSQHGNTYIGGLTEGNVMGSISVGASGVANNVFVGQYNEGDQPSMRLAGQNTWGIGGTWANDTTREGNKLGSTIEFRKPFHVIDNGSGVNTGADENNSPNFYIENDGLADAVNTAQYSPWFMMRGRAWDTGLLASRTFDFRQQITTTSANPATGTLTWGWRDSRGVPDAVTTASSLVLTSATANFQVADEGKRIEIRPRVVGDGVTNSGSTTVTSTTAGFVAGDVDKRIVLLSSTGLGYLTTTIASRVSATEITVTTAPDFTATGVELKIGRTFSSTIASRTNSTTVQLGSAPDFSATGNLMNIAGAFTPTFSSDSTTNTLKPVRLAAAAIVTFTNADATPSVSAGNLFKTNNSGATTITMFDDGVAGQAITVTCTDANTTISDAGNLKLNGAFTCTADDTLTLWFDGTNWFEKARSAN